MPRINTAFQQVKESKIHIFCSLERIVLFGKSPFHPLPAPNTSSRALSHEPFPWHSTASQLMLWHSPASGFNDQNTWGWIGDKIIYISARTQESRALKRGMSGISPRSGHTSIFAVRGCLHHLLPLQLLCPWKAALCALWDSKGCLCIPPQGTAPAWQPWFCWWTWILPQLYFCTPVSEDRQTEETALPNLHCPTYRQHWLLGQWGAFVFLWQGTLLPCFPARICKGVFSRGCGSMGASPWFCLTPSWCSKYSGGLC